MSQEELTADPAVPKSAIEELRASARGEVLRPGDDGYDEHRSVWNAMIDREPGAILRCTGASDVITGVQVAREHDLLLAVKGGGHNVAGNAVCDDGLVLDLSPMDGVRVDPDGRTAWVQGGATWADFDHEAQAFGLATTGGIMHSTGVGGLTLGGGLGWLARKYGLAHDNLRAVELVTADGDLVRASEEEHPELFWGVRGGGGNFGVVTAFQFDLHELGTEVLAGGVYHRREDAADLLRFYRELMADAPDDLQCYIGMQQAPSGPPFPEDVHGEPVIGAVACYAGPIEEGREVLEPLRSFGDPVVDAVRVQPYTQFQHRMDTEQWRKGNRNYWKSHNFRTFPDGAIETMVEYMDTFPTAMTSVFIEWMGGAIAEADDDATAFPHRDKSFAFTIAPIWTDPARDEECIDWAREYFEALEPYAAEGVYVNYLGQEGDERVRDAYHDRYDRLVALKNEWDPGNVFRMNQNIEPAVTD